MQLSKPVSFGVASKDVVPASPQGSFVFCEGWGESEPWGTWSNGKEARIYLPLPEQRPKSMTLQFQAFVFDKHPEQLLTIQVNAHEVIKKSIRSPKENRVTIPLDAADWEKGYALVKFQFANPISPKQAGHSIDDRPLAIGLESVVFQP